MVEPADELLLSFVFNSVRAVTPSQFGDGCARREFLEETRYACANPRLLAEFSSQALGYDGDFDLVFFWDRYDGIQEIECREGQALRFVSRSDAENLPSRDYLTKVWDLALSARAAP